MTEYEISRQLELLLGFCTGFLTIIGWLIAYKVRRSKEFRFKLFIIYFIPFILCIDFFYSNFDLQHTYRTILFVQFTFMLQLLYWREMKLISCSSGYFKSALYSFMELIPDLVWIKDKDNRFKYINKACKDKLLLLDKEEILGSTSSEISKKIKNKGINYTFGEICCDSDEITKDEGRSCRFFESGIVDDNFLVLQVYKTPIKKNGKIIGTVGIGRDLTYDFKDHEEIKNLLDRKEYDKATKLFDKHINRFKVSACKGEV